jgi:hypothetical protein
MSPRVFANERCGARVAQGNRMMVTATAAAQAWQMERVGVS